MKLIFKGIVQGVGFRPTIYRVATELGLKGYVLNKGSEVEVVIDRDVERFLRNIKQELPSIAVITSIEKHPDSRRFSSFKILHSKQGEKHSQIPADVATCDDCIHELFDEKNRRYLFPFTNCTVCGARFSLITDVPYDRERTSMDAFPLCHECTHEYRDVSNRRYHAQTISCPTCGPHYRLYDTKKKDLGADNAIERFAGKIDAGSIGVIKSWGGMHLCCILDELERFREWYGRPQKAFALMVRDVKAAQKYGTITPDERRLLMSHQRPIVLVQKKTAELVSPGLSTIGLFLPYTGLHHLLFSFLSTDALVMTSANIPGEPMLLSNDEVFCLQAEYYLLHNRTIPNRTDDSVILLWNGHRFFLRKSRGFVPEPLAVPYLGRVLSVGAGENITGAVSVDKKLYATQYIGNAHYYSTVEFLEQSLRHLMKLFMKTPGLDAVVMDAHPGYETRQVAERFASEFSAPVFEVQHHWAHAAALLVDRQRSREVVLALDGLGYGADGTFWGGEVLDASFSKYSRVGHLEALPLIGGDQATRDPRRLVFALFSGDRGAVKFSDEESQVFHKLQHHAPLCSSLGRVLDALSCYLGVCMTRTYSGEPAMKLEKYLAMGKPRYRLPVETKQNVVQVLDAFRHLDEQLSFPLSEQQKADAAYSLVSAVVGALTDIAVDHTHHLGKKHVGLTGGVSYNVPITEMVQSVVKKAGLDALVHERVPNGDGCISVGQNVLIGHRLSSHD